MNVRLASRVGLEMLLAFGLLPWAAAAAATAWITSSSPRLSNVEREIWALPQAAGEPRAGQSSAEGPVARLESQSSTKEQPAKPVNGAETPRSDAGNEVIARIRDEGLHRSQVMQTLSYLTDVIGPRLTGSPNLKRANQWTRDKLSSWGLTNAHLEAWGVFGRGWSLKRFSAQIIEPQTIPLIGYPKAWSPGFGRPLVAGVIYLDAKTESDLEKYKGKLKGAVVLTSPVREVTARFEPLARRLAETNLLRLANAGAPRASSGARGQSGGNLGRRVAAASTANQDAAVPPDPARAQSEPGPGRRGGLGAGRTNLFQGRVLSFVAKEGAALVVTPSTQGDGGTFFVSAASVPGAPDRGSGASTNAQRVWSTRAPVVPPQITLAIEDYNRLIRMIQLGEKLKMEVDLQVKFHDHDLMAYNTLAEIPGSDLKAELVMLGGHMDSWHSGTGATDNGAGVAVAMEAVRILKALDLQPRRTIRIGLWTGEEQGLLGSKAYVAKHFGYYTNITNGVLARARIDEASGSPAEPASTNAGPRRTLIREPDYEKFSAYFNLDNGTGKIRGVYMQGNEAMRPIFRRWLQSFEDLGAETLTVSNTGGTDHQSFDGIGLPGFQFIQDPIEYGSRTHHSNADVFDRIQPDDLKQAAVIMAAFVYNASMMDEKLPRKPID
jgi:carboxypeptidase Q